VKDTSFTAAITVIATMFCNSLSATYNLSPTDVRTTDGLASVLFNTHALIFQTNERL